MQPGTRRSDDTVKLAAYTARCGVVALSLLVLSGCSMVEAIDTLSNLPPAPADPAVTTSEPVTTDTAPDEAGAYVPLEPPDRDVRERPAPRRETAPLQPHLPSKEAQIRRLKNRLESLRRHRGGDAPGSWRLGPGVEGVGSVRDNMISNRIRELERDIRLGR